MNTRILGIDLAVSAAHKAVILDQERNDFVGPVINFGTNPAEMDKLLKASQAGLSRPAQVVAVLEATGMAWYTVGSYLSQHGVAVYRVNGQVTAAQRKVYQRRAKSDRIDARVLARMYLTIPERLHPVYLPDARQLALQRACREYDRLSHQATAIQNRMQATDQLAWLLPKGLWPKSPTAAVWLRRHWYDPWEVVRSGLSTLERHWQMCFPDQEADWLPGWVQHAQLVTAFYGRSDWLDYAQLRASQAREQERLEGLVDQLERLTRQVIHPLYHQLHPERHLESLYGIGENSAAIYIAFIGNIQRFPTPAHFRSWCGLIPYSDQSGFAQSKGLHITQAGPDLIKKTAYLNAEVARLYDPQIAAVYYDQMMHKGKHHLQAVCTCAAHLLNRIYAILRDQRPYELRTPDGQPIEKSQARLFCQQHYLVPDEVRRRNCARVRKSRTELHTEQRYQRLNRQRSKG